ncbi:hypothetical protein ABTX15_30850 [Micromonospora sp. NPDC094482]|uniref:hypothetical protein n=1 Tax=unclassified Micromonospora TaxID=2617518 RepID=UPI003329D287
MSEVLFRWASVMEVALRRPVRRCWAQTAGGRLARYWMTLMPANSGSWPVRWTGQVAEFRRLSPPGSGWLMNRNLVKGLQVAWGLPEFRDGVRHLIDLDEVALLLAALSVPDHDHEVERSLLSLLRSGLDTIEIREAVLLLLEQDDVRRPLVAALVEPLADRPAQAAAIASAAEDPTVRREVRAVLDSAKVRELIWQTIENQVSDDRFGLVRRAAVLFVRHRSVRRLVWAVRRHGVLRELRRKP